MPKRKYAGSYASSKRRRTVVPRRRRRPVAGRGAIARIAKQVQMKTCETKQSSQYTADQQIVFHNKTYYAGNLLATTQGTTDPSGVEQATRNRVGDEVIARGLSLKIFLQNDSERPNVMYRVIIFKYNTLAIATPGLSDTFFWSGPNGQGLTMNRMLDRPQTDRIKVIKSIVVNPSHEANFSIQTAGPVPVGPFAKTRMYKFWIPLKNRRIKYNEDGGNYPRYVGYGFCVTPYDAISTLETDTLCYLQWQSTFYFKDP